LLFFIIFLFEITSAIKVYFMLLLFNMRLSHCIFNMNLIWRLLNWHFKKGTYHYSFSTHIMIKSTTHEYSKPDGIKYSYLFFRQLINAFVLEEKNILIKYHTRILISYSKLSSSLICKSLQKYLTTDKTFENCYK